jgi:hypothetical protein
MNRTEEIFERLRHQQPSISNPDELTSSIMSRLDDANVKKTEGGRMAVVRTLRIVSSMAAVWLLGLFIFVNYAAENQRNVGEVIHDGTQISRSSVLKKMYAEHQQKNQTKQLNYTQLKRMIYENR